MLGICLRMLGICAAKLFNPRQVYMLDSDPEADNYDNH